jgi:arsenical pump membrane protein
MSALVAPLLLIAVLAFAVAAPRGLPEATVAVPAALLVVALGLLSPGAAAAEVERLAPTVAFLAAILVLARLVDVAGVFSWLGERMSTAARDSPRQLLRLVFGAAALTTAVLSLDPTVVLLTPVVLGAAAALRLRTAPYTFACAHLANSASLLLPVSNLTNLLALEATGLTFLSFAALMALPWLAVLAVEYVGFRWFFAADLDAPVPPRPAPAPATPTPRYAFAVLAATLVGFGVSSLVGIAPVWSAVAGVAALAAPALRAGRLRVVELVAAAAPLFCLFVLALGVVVAAVFGNGWDALVGSILPADPDLAGLLGTAVLAAVLANLVNNLPAALLLLAVLGPAAPPGLVLAMLIGVNVGPNLGYVGSLATLLWRRVVTAAGPAPSFGEFARVGLLTVPPALVAGVLALWVALQVSG